MCRAHLAFVVDTVFVQGKGHKVVQRGQYWITGRVNSITMRRGWRVQSAPSSENRPEQNEIDSFVLQSIIQFHLLNRKFDLSVPVEFKAATVLEKSKRFKHHCEQQTLFHTLHRWLNIHYYYTAHILVTAA